LAKQKAEEDKENKMEGKYKPLELHKAELNVLEKKMAKLHNSRIEIKGRWKVQFPSLTTRKALLAEIEATEASLTQTTPGFLSSLSCRHA